MAQKLAKRLGQISSQTRATVALEREEASQIEKAEKMATIINKYSKKSSRTFEKGSYRRNQRESISKSTIRSPKKGFRRNEISARCEQIKPAYQSIQVSNDDRFPSETRTKKRMLYSICRFKRCLLACANPQETKKISCVCSGRSGLPVQSHALRVEHRPTRVHKDYEACGSQTSKARNKYCHVSGRLANNRYHTPTVQNDGKRNPKSRKIYGPSFQFEKIPLGTHQKSRMARFPMGYREINAVPIRGQLSTNVEEAVQSSKLQMHDAQAMGKPGWVTELRSPSDTLCQNKTQEVDYGRPQDVQDCEPRPANQVPTRPPRTPSLVDQGCQTEINLAMDPRKSYDDPYHRCFRLGLGLPDLSRTPRLRPVEGQVANDSHQWQRASSCPPSFATRTRSERDGDSCPIGQHGYCSLCKSSRINTIANTPEDFRRTFPTCEKAKATSSSSSPGRQAEPVGRCAIKTKLSFSRMGTETGRVRQAYSAIRKAEYRPVRFGVQSQNREVCDQIQSNIDSGSRRYGSGLEPMGIHLLVSSSKHNTDDESNFSFEGFSGESSPDRSEMGVADMEPRSDAVVPRASSPSPSGPGRRDINPIDVITSSSRMEFLRWTLNKSMDEETVKDILAGHRASTARQYESSWKKLQNFLRQTNIETINQHLPAQFASYLFHKRKLSIASIKGHLSAVADPLSFAFGIICNNRSIELLKASFFLQRPDKKKGSPSWSLDKVLNMLSQDKYVIEPTPINSLHRALFLIALASGMRVSELAALSRYPSLTVFGIENTMVTLATNPKFLAKNERVNHRMKPKRIPAWKIDGNHHPLCPVAALQQYMSIVKSKDSNTLWMSPKSKRRYQAKHIAKELCNIINLADPGKSPTAHQIRRISSSLAYGRTLNLDVVQEEGQWASSRTFIDRYLDLEVPDAPCVVMGQVPK